MYHSNSDDFKQQQFPKNEKNKIEVKLKIYHQSRVYQNTSKAYYKTHQV